MQSDNDLHTAWQRAALTVNGRLSPTGVGGQRLVTYLGKQLVRAEIKPVGDGWMTTITSGAPRETALRLAVSFDPNFPYADSFPISVTDDFDARFTTHTDDAPYARLWLGPEVRAAIARTEGYHLVLYDGVARGWRFGAERDAEALVAAMRAVVALARGGALVQGDWHSLAAHLGGRDVSTSGGPDGGMTMTVKPNWGPAIQIEGFYGHIARRREGRGVVTRLRCPCNGDRDDACVIDDADDGDGFAPKIAGTTELELVAGRYRVRCSNPVSVRRRLVDGLADAIVELAPSAIVVTSELATVLLPELVTDAERMIAAIDVLRVLAGEQPEPRAAGPYR